MKRYFLALLALLSANVLFAQRNQPASPLVFEESVWDFGRFEEAGGPVSHTFKFKNTATTPIVIERVVTSCGCTTPEYSRQPVRPGQESQITITYDPDGRPGRFSREVNIITGGGKNRNTITIKGVVNPRPHTIADDYAYDFGHGLRGSTSHKGFSYVAQGTTKSVVVDIANESAAPIALGYEWEEKSGLLSVALPAKLEPEERAQMTLTYDLTSKEHYGELLDKIRLTIDGKRATMSLTASGTGIDKFPENLRGQKVARFGLSPAFYNFGRVSRDMDLTTTITIVNQGDADLIVRSVEPRKHITTDLKAGTVVPARGEHKFKVTLVVGEKDGGDVFGTLTIVANDPERPMREIRLSAVVL